MKMHSNTGLSLPLLICGVAFSGMSSPAHAGWTDEGTSIGSQCSAADVNDAAVVVGNCIASNVRIGFVAAIAGHPAPLAPLTATGIGGVACVIGGINNGSLANALIVGACQDKNSVMQAVYWHANAPSTPPTQLKVFGLGVQGLLTDVRTSETSINLQGTIVGVSIDGSDNQTPVVWSASGVATALGGLLQASTTNCKPSDISDTGAVVGNCPAGASGAGKNNAILWTTTATNYVTLPIPAGASFCTANEINLGGQILGEYVFSGVNSTPDTYRAVRWASGGRAAPAVLATINQSATLRSTAIDMNASGQITGDYLSTSGFALPFFWDPGVNGGNTNATSIGPLTNGSRATATAIADSSVVVGCGEVAPGLSVGFYSHSGAAPTAIAPVAGGGNDCVTAVSKNGAFISGVSEIASGNGEEADAVVENTP